MRAGRNLIGRWGGRNGAGPGADSAREPERAPLGGTRAEAIQRVQVGLSGLSAMILIIFIASVIGDQANIAEEAAVPDAAATTEPTAAAPQRDPLADAGVVPDVPSQPDADEAALPPGGSLPGSSEAGTVPDTPPTEPLDTRERR